jgi:hypothetical protein
VVDSKLAVDGIEHRRFADGRIVSRDEISRGSQCRHGHPRRGRQPRHDHTSVKGRGDRARRDSDFADHRACENDRVPQTPLWELADASTLFSAVAALRPGRAPVFHDRSEPPRSCHILPTLACEWFSQQSCHQGPFGLRSSWVSLSYRAETAAWIDDVLPDQQFGCAQIPWRRTSGPVRPALLQEMPSPAALPTRLSWVALPRPPWNPLLVRTSVIKWPLVTRLLGLADC